MAVPILTQRASEGTGYASTAGLGRRPSLARRVSMGRGHTQPGFDTRVSNPKSKISSALISPRQHRIVGPSQADDTKEQKRHQSRDRDRAADPERCRVVSIDKPVLARRNRSPAHHAIDPVDRGRLAVDRESHPG